jgi:hypothetical protein
LDLHQTFRISSISSTNMIYDVKMTPILHGSSQEPSTSSKSHLLQSQPNHVGSSSNFQDIFHIIYQHDLWSKDDHDPPSLQSGTINILQVQPSPF